MNRSRIGSTASNAHRKDRGQHGQALVEFAIAAPVIFVLLMALFDMGRLVYINNELSFAAREGARWGAVQSRAADQAAGTNTGVSDAASASIVVAPAPVVTVGCVDIRAGGAACTSGDLLTVSISASVEPITPLIGDFLGPMILSSEAKMAIQ